MKVSNETKVGALTAVAITVLILGFNYLKGKNITQRKNTIYAVFPDVEGLNPATGVLINGLQVGRISDLEEKDKNMSGIVVTIHLSKDINIPSNSFATINKSLLGSANVDIELGNSTSYISDGDTLQVKATADLASQLKTTLDPAMDNINKTLVSLDAVIQKLNSIIDPNVKNNLQSTIANLASSSKSLNDLLNTQTGALAKTLSNVESITGNLKNSNGKIDSTLNNLQRTTSKLADAKLNEIIEDLRKTVTTLEATIAKANSPNSSIGALLNDRKLYDEIRQTNRSLTILLDDFKTNPKRYVNVSVFGKKDKSKPLAKPIYDSIPEKGN